MENERQTLNDQLAKFYDLAKIGNTKFQYLLGLAYARGQECKIDLNLAQYWLQKAADAGHDLAMIELVAIMEYHDEYIILEGEALGYLRESIKGSSEDMADLGACYYEGFSGAPQNYELAVKWFKISTEYQSPVGAYLLAMCYKDGTGVKKSPYMACKYYRLAAELGDAWSMYMYAMCCINGNGRDIDELEGYTWAKKASNEGVEEANDIIEDYSYYEKERNN